MRLYTQWQRPILKRLINPSLSIPRETSIDSDCCHLLTVSVLSSKADKLCSIGFNQQVKVSQGHTSYGNKENRNTEVHGGGYLERVKPVRKPASSRPKSCASLKRPTNLARLPPLVGPRRKKTVVRHQLFLQKPFGSLLRFSRTGDQQSHGSSTIKLPSDFAKSGAYPPNRVLPVSPQQPSLPLAFRYTSRGASIWSSEEARTWEHHPQPTIRPPSLNRQAESRRQPVTCISLGQARPLHPLRRPSHSSTRKPGFGRRGDVMEGGTVQSRYDRREAVNCRKI